MLLSYLAAYDRQVNETEHLLNMATRSQIGFYEAGDQLSKPTALIYRHWDGYPEGVLNDIIPILKDFDQNRGLADVEYAAAWLVAKLKKDDYLNIGICKSLHGDIEYYYAVYPDRIDVYEPKDFGAWLEGEGHGFEHLKLKDTILLGKGVPEKYLVKN